MTASSARAERDARTPDLGGARPAASVVLRAGCTRVWGIRRWVRSGIPVFYVDRAAGVWRLMSPERVGARALLLDAHAVPQEAMCALADRAFALLLARSAEVAWSRHFFGSPDIDQAFRRWLFMELTGLFQLLEALKQSGLDPMGEIRVLGASRPVAALLKRGHQVQIGEVLWEQVPASYRMLLRRMVVEDGFVGLRGTLAMVRQLIGAVLFVARRVLWRGQPRRTCPLAIRTYPADFGINLDGFPRLRSVDFIVDHDTIRPEDVVFWVEEGTPAARLAEFSARGYCWARPSRLGFDPTVLWWPITGALLAYLWMRVRLNPRSEIAGGCVTELWRTWLKAHAFAAYFNPRAILYYNDWTYSAVARNLALRGAGCLVIVYMHACNHSIDRSGEWGVSPAVSFLVSDHFVSWGRWHSRHVAQGPGKPGEMWELGCLWSEHARLVREDRKVRKAYLDQIETSAGVRLSGFRRIIGVFDTSPSSMLSHDDLYWFLVGNLELAHKMPGVVFLYKPKNPVVEVEPEEDLPLIEAFGSKGRELWQKISATPNFVILHRYFETASVVGLADLVISACFTSTTVEAIGCGTRSVYYDPTDKFPQAFWRRIPGMVCVKAQELHDRVSYLVWDCAEETYTAYLRTYCVGLDGYFDGQAITRLRQRLVDVISRRASGTATESG